ncbi:Global transcription regulator sge1 [Lachnellula suecica]|uniref:Global transcription regulator sge1 n=1 Tax=Lachnellula suecica TaxID=602035 RepID=A0A8T9BZ44_9HELO|nr:Global transcription regulator sge1 [Lachnellula suecica]
MASASPLSPTFYGHIASIQDAVLLFEACLSGALNPVARRPHGRERPNLTMNGNVFIFDGHFSGIKRWNDSVPWSPSRMLGDFLVYRELNHPFLPGEKKKATKRNKKSAGIGKPEPSGAPENGVSNGSLVDSYGFKEEGLVKKTISVIVDGVSHHLVSYYKVADVLKQKFTTPSADPRFQHITPRPDLVAKQNFRTRIHGVELVDDTSSPARNGYEMTNESIPHRPTTLPIPPMACTANSNVYGGYGSSPHSASYDNMGQPSSGSLYSGHLALSPGAYPAIENYGFGGCPQQRSNSVIGIGSEAARTIVPPVTTDLAYQPPNVDQRSSIESRWAEMPPSSTASTHRSLPTSTQQTGSF